ncbi:class I SAM-dependent methyltransferase [Streptomyces sp. NPDC050529]|uniref:class I SAM-dependent methyltransferase n=1 Tax=unclassified Streptomyces TaxID=2593676 RepID=UPI002DD9C054|nr:MULTISPECIES: class I SAM-dependent methyltransferase [unclassified Streptomyces]MEE4494076.1 class I SAM-dependent methyltransferase [Streptomyces sp. BE230]WRZ87523.1 class I SAM-dependent methyltransferase [Streptomyces sp. NBC_01022]
MRIQVELSDAVQDYVADVSLRETDLLRELREKTSELPLHLMQISPEQGQFLSLLVKAIGARRTLEVGVFTGYSLLSTALALPEDGSVVALDLDAGWAATAMEFCGRAGVAGKVDLRLGDARDTLAELVREEGAPGSFDFVFIDADKEGYAEYYEAALKLLRPGGLVVVDNVLWHGAVVNPEAQDSETRALRAFNAKLRDDKRVDLSLLPFADGLTFALKR